MTIVFTAPPQGESGFEARCLQSGTTPVRVAQALDFQLYPDADLYIDAAFNGTFSDSSTPLLFHCPALPFSRIPSAPENSARFCAWPQFWERDTWEIVPKIPGSEIFNSILSQFGIHALKVADIAGLIAPRILCTLINEAAYTLDQGVADAADIDTAMKLGTNYPLGPAEWAKIIGYQELKNVMDAMALENEKYSPHRALTQIAR